MFCILVREDYRMGGKDGFTGLKPVRIGVCSERGWEDAPQRLKPLVGAGWYGTAKAVP
jgi:hypothetical protein